jgi:hypothetical protein
MVKTLTAIHRKLDSIRHEHGSPLSYGQYVTRVAMALGIKEIVERTREEQTSWERRDILYVVDNRVATLREECRQLDTGKTA